MEGKTNQRTMRILKMPTMMILVFLTWTHIRQVDSILSNGGENYEEKTSTKREIDERRFGPRVRVDTPIPDLPNRIRPNPTKYQRDGYRAEYRVWHSSVYRNIVMAAISTEDPRSVYLGRGISSAEREIHDEWTREKVLAAQNWAKGIDEMLAMIHSGKFGQMAKELMNAINTASPKSKALPFEGALERDDDVRMPEANLYILREGESNGATYGETHYPIRHLRTDDHGALRPYELNARQKDDEKTAIEMATSLDGGAAAVDRKSATTPGHGSRAIFTFNQLAYSGGVRRLELAGEVKEIVMSPLNILLHESIHALHYLYGVLDPSCEKRQPCCCEEYRTVGLHDDLVPKIPNLSYFEYGHINENDILRERNEKMEERMRTEPDAHFRRQKLRTEYGDCTRESVDPSHEMPPYHNCVRFWEDV